MASFGLHKQGDKRASRPDMLYDIPILRKPQRLWLDPMITQPRVARGSTQAV